MQDTPKPAATPAPAAAQPQRAQRPQLPGLFFDSDMGRNIDTVLALSLLYGSHDKVKIIGNSISHNSLEAAAFCDVIGRFFAGPVSNAPFSPGYYNPIGMPEDGPKLASVAMLSKPMAMKNAEGKPALYHNVNDLTDTADVRICLRNALLSQKDGEGIIVLAGPAGNMVRALGFPGNKELVAAKAGVLVAALGSYGPNAPADPRVKADLDAARRLFAEWPTPIVVAGVEAGLAVPYPAASIEKDFAWSPNHPVPEAYKAWKPMPYDAPSQAVAAALYAANRAGDFFELSEPGTIQVLDGGRTRWEKSANGKHRYLIVPAAKKAQIVEAYTTMASAKPAPPPVRFRPQQQADAAAPVPAPIKVAQ